MDLKKTIQIEMSESNWKSYFYVDYSTPIDVLEKMFSRCIEEFEEFKEKIKDLSDKNINSSKDGGSCQ